MLLSLLHCYCLLHVKQFGSTLMHKMCCINTLTWHTIGCRCLDAGIVQEHVGKYIEQDWKQNTSPLIYVLEYTVRGVCCGEDPLVCGDSGCWRHKSKQNAFLLMKGINIKDNVGWKEGGDDDHMCWMTAHPHSLSVPSRPAGGSRTGPLHAPSPAPSSGRASCGRGNTGGPPHAPYHHWGQNNKDIWQVGIPSYHKHTSSQLFR